MSQKIMLYEIMYIIPAKYSDSEIEGMTKTVSLLLEKHGAEIKKTMNLGKLKFAYSIKKQTHGTYILNFIEVDGSALSKIDAELRLADEVLRHITIRRESGIPEHEIVLTPYVAPITPEGKRVVKKTRQTKESPTVLTAPAENVSAEEIKKKLDEILDDDTLTEEAK